MAGCPEKAFVPSKDGTAEARAKNFAVIDGTDAGEVSMMYFRRPVTKAFAEYVIGLFEQTFEDTDGGYQAAFAMDYSALLDMANLYRLAGKTAPSGLASRLADWHAANPKLNKAAGGVKCDALFSVDGTFSTVHEMNNTIPVASTLATETKSAMVTLDAAAREVFGAGLSRLLAPVHWLVRCQRAGLSAADMVRQLPVPKRMVLLKKPPPKSQKVQASTSLVVPHSSMGGASGTASPPVAAAPSAAGLASPPPAASASSGGSGSVSSSGKPPALSDECSTWLLEYCAVHKVTISEARAMLGV